MRAALVDYYNRRHDTAERLAANHERTRDELIASARSLEDGDQTGRRQVTQAGGIDHKAPPVGPTPGASTDPAAPVGTSPDTPTVNGTQPGRRSALTPDAPGMSDETGRSDQAPLAPAASAPQTYDTAPAGATAPTWTTPLSVDIPVPGAADIPVTPAINANSAAGMVSGIGAPLATGPFAAAVVVGAAVSAGGCLHHWRQARSRQRSTRSRTSRRYRRSW